MADNRDSQLPRRSFCNRALVTSAGLLLVAGEAKSQGENPQKPNPPENPGQNLLMYPPMKIEGAERLLPGSFLYFNYPKSSDAAVLVRSAESQFLAFSRRCAHRGCSVDFDKARGCLVCPCHRGVYDTRTGYVMYGPPPRPLDQIILQVRSGGEVWAVGKRTGGEFNA